MHRRRSLGEVSVDRSRVGPGLRSPRWTGADTPVHTHIHARTDTQIDAHTRAHNKRACSCIGESPLARAASLSRMHSRALRARTRVCVCACASDTLPVSQCVRQARRGASPSVAASRPAKILARSVCPLASLSFPLSLSFRRALRGPLFSPPLVVPPRPSGSRSLFSVSVTPPKGPPPSLSLRPSFLPRASLHFDCIVATAREKTLR